MIERNDVNYTAIRRATAIAHVCEKSGFCQKPDFSSGRTQNVSQRER